MPTVDVLCPCGIRFKDFRRNWFRIPHATCKKCRAESKKEYTNRWPHLVGTCERCGKTFDLTTLDTPKYCSDRCKRGAARARRNAPTGRIRRNRPCAVCGKFFGVWAKPDDPGPFYCSSHTPPPGTAAIGANPAIGTGLSNKMMAGEPQSENEHGREMDPEGEHPQGCASRGTGCPGGTEDPCQEESGSPALERSQGPEDGDPRTDVRQDGQGEGLTLREVFAAEEK